MNQIIRELNAAADAIDVAAEKSDGTYLPGFADGIRHATRILDDSDTSGPPEPHQKRNPCDITVNTADSDYWRSIQDKVDEMVDRSQSYMAHGY